MYKNGRFFYKSYKRFKPRRRYSNFHNHYWFGERLRLSRRKHKAKIDYDPVNGQDYISVHFK